MIDIAIELLSAIILKEVDMDDPYYKTQHRIRSQRQRIKEIEDVKIKVAKYWKYFTAVSAGLLGRTHFAVCSLPKQEPRVCRS